MGEVPAIVNADSGNIAAAINAGAQVALPRHQSGYKPYTIDGKGEIQLLTREDERPRPERITCKPVFHDAPSFISYVNTYKDSDSKLFADVDNSQVQAILDYHEDGEITGDSPDGNLPRYCSHRALFAPKHSEEWKVWAGSNKKQMSQDDFAQFIEDNLPDIQSPSGAELLEVALSLSANVTSSFKRALRLDNGAVRLNYSEEIDGKAGSDGELTIPREFTLLLRCYLSCEAMPFIARLRYRIQSGKLVLWYDLLRAEIERRKVFDALLGTIEEGTKVKPLIGTYSN